MQYKLEPTEDGEAVYQFSGYGIGPQRIATRLMDEDNNCRVVIYGNTGEDCKARTEEILAKLNRRMGV